MKYLAERITIGFLALLLVATTTFFLMHLVPGDPLSQEKNLLPEVRENLEEYYGLNKPIHVQYFAYMTNMFLRGDFGISFKQAHRSVNDIIKDHFWISAVLGFIAIGFAFFCGVTLGTIASIYRNEPLDYFSMLFSLCGYSIPSFVLAYFLQYIFALQLKWLPVGGWDGIDTMLLPGISLGMVIMASISRLMRNSMLDVLNQEYIKTARAKGLSAKKILFKHQMRNALLPIIVYLGPLFAIILTGSFVIESIFGVPGLGQFFVNSVRELDYTVIMGLTVFYSGFAIFSAIIFDFIYGFLDPRIRLAA